MRTPNFLTADRLENAIAEACWLAFFEAMGQNRLRYLASPRIGSGDTMCYMVVRLGPFLSI